MLSEAPLDLAVVTASVEHPGHGAVLTFAGVARNDAEHDPDRRALLSLYYEAWTEVALRELGAVEEETRRRWPVRIAIAHRVGTVGVGEPSVIIAVSAPHRPEAYEASRFAIDSLKARVPIWKKETYADGSTWVGNRP